ncbi:MAG: hypothetical protein M1825_003472 [Sarcosagium campestre]|nr:MAG: hypothetical protein M1825_003472 [Sarcosagium campestre]
MGCANYHAWLIFDNGDRWLVRIPRSPFSDIPASLVEYLVASEYATLKFLEGTKVPAPRAFGYGLESQDVNDVGVNFILLEALPGRPFEAYDASSEHKDRVFDAVADVLIELSKHPFPKAGSLSIGSDGNLAIGPVASNRFVKLDRYGPFESTKEYFHDITEQYLDLIADGQVYPEYPVESFLIYTILQEQVQHLESGVLEEQFFIKHVDDKGDHLLVDEQGNLTGIIDWQFTRSAPALEAFGPSLFTADLDALYAGHSCITQDDRKLAACLRDKGATALANLMEAKEMTRRFHFGLASHMSRIESFNGESRILGVMVAIDLTVKRKDLNHLVCVISSAQSRVALLRVPSHPHLAISDIYNIFQMQKDDDEFRACTSD